MGKYINPFTDWGFKRLFGQEFSKPLLISFLNDLLVDELHVKDLTFRDKELLPPRKTSVASSAMSIARRTPATALSLRCRTVGSRTSSTAPSATPAVVSSTRWTRVGQSVRMPISFCPFTRYVL